MQEYVNEKSILEPMHTTSPHLQILLLVSIPEQSHTLIDKIRLIPDLDEDLIYHLVRLHVLDNMVEEAVIVSEVTVVAWIGRCGILAAVGTPHV
jgi:hypothetical protein